MATVLIRNGGLVIRDGDWLLEDPITLTPAVPAGGGGYGGVAIRKGNMQIIRDLDRERKKKEDEMVALVLLLDSRRR